MVLLYYDSSLISFSYLSISCGPPDPRWNFSKIRKLVIVCFLSASSNRIASDQLRIRLFAWVIWCFEIKLRLVILLGKVNTMYTESCVAMATLCSHNMCFNSVGFFRRSLRSRETTLLENGSFNNSFSLITSSTIVRKTMQVSRQKRRPRMPEFEGSHCSVSQ